jgi:CHASE3 domain sensor protein
MVRWFSNLKIAHKLLLGFGLVLVLMATTLVTDVLASRQQTSVVDQLVDRLYPSRQTANQIVTLVYAANNARLV